MPADLEELDYRRTPLGELVLRRRRYPAVPGRVIYEVKLGDQFLMSSLFTAAEVALAERALARLGGAGPLAVAVGGLGLGYTAAAVLDDPRVGSLVVIEALAEVIEWHRAGLVPLGARLVAERRCRLVHGDFFALAADPARGLDPGRAGRRLDAVLVDIDHSPRDLLVAGGRSFYRPAGLAALAAGLRDGGVFGLWSNDPPDARFASDLGAVLDDVAAEVISFPNPFTGAESSNTVYLATRR